MIKNKTSSGFTLIEVAIVLVIIGFLIGSLIVPLGSQRQTIQIKQARQELKMIEEAILGFAIANGRLPCPSSGDVAGGNENPGGGGACVDSRGFIPAVTLGISGRFNCDNLLIDPWGNPYRYSVTVTSVADEPANPLNSPDFTTSNEMRYIFQDPLLTLNPNLTICSTSACGTNLTIDAVAVIYSMGKHWNNIVSADELENSETTIAGTGCGLASYAISNDNRYVHRESVEIAGSEYDDIVIWISPNILYAKLLAAGQL